MATDSRVCPPRRICQTSSTPSGRHAGGTRASLAIWFESYSDGALDNEALNHIGFTQAAFGIIFLRTLVPLFCLLLGYWAALARPQDLNAWLILILLCVPEAYASVSFYNWWPEWLPLRLFWLASLSVIAPGALIWLGIAVSGEVAY